MEASTILALTAIGISVATAWFSLFHKGTVRMTQPGIFAIMAKDQSRNGTPKIFVRTLLYSTGRRGYAVENLFAEMHCGDTMQPFFFWGHGEREQLVPGSGLFVGPEGREGNHHFLIFKEGSDYLFPSGDCSLKIYGKLMNKSKPKLLRQIEFSLTESEAATLAEDPDSAVIFNWYSGEQRYRPQVDRRPSRGRSHSVSGSGHGPFAWE